LKTPPLERGSLPLIVLSMVHQRDVHSYLVAIKTFTHFVNPKRIVVVCDPSIDHADRALLSQHVPHVEFRHAREFTHPDVPRGGCWERLLGICEFVKDNYVVQLDADTLTMQPIPEVADAVRSRSGFVLGEEVDTPIRSLPAARQHALQWLGPDAHIQAIAETEMVNVGLPENARYIRGCAGFTGFPPSAEMLDKVIDFSRRMSGKLGPDWKRWGTEQVTSNFVVSNSHGVRVLPFPKYGTPDQATTETAFFHFIGFMRFINNRYETTSRQAIRLINSTSA
jgi:hypothetical protein